MTDPDRLRRAPDADLARALRETAAAMADAARAEALRLFRSPALSPDNKLATGFDPVTEADRAAAESPVQRFHLDLRLPPEDADRRIKAALDAGGTLVSDAVAPRFTVLADAQGNKACVTTWLGRG